MRRQIVLPEDVAMQIEQILRELRTRARADCTFLADISGQVIDIHGGVEDMDPIVMAALAAGELATMEELTRQIGDRSFGRSLLHEGERRSLYICNVHGTFVLVVVFSTDTPVGLVRLFVRRAIERLSPLADRFEEIVRQDKSVLGVDFSAALSDELDKAFGGI